MSFDLFCIKNTKMVVQSVYDTIMIVYKVKKCTTVCLQLKCIVSFTFVIINKQEGHDGPGSLT